jgi:hypothetical protein
VRPAAWWGGGVSGTAAPPQVDNTTGMGECIGASVSTSIFKLTIDDNQIEALQVGSAPCAGGGGVSRRSATLSPPPHLVPHREASPWPKSPAPGRVTSRWRS